MKGAKIRGRELKDAFWWNGLDVLRRKFLNDIVRFDISKANLDVSITGIPLDALACIPLPATQLAVVFSGNGPSFNPP